METDAPPVKVNKTKNVIKNLSNYCPADLNKPQLFAVFVFDNDYFILFTLKR